MKRELLSEAIGGIDCRYVEEAADFAVKRSPRIKRIVCAAACLLLVAASVPFILKAANQDEGKPFDPGQVGPGQVGPGQADSSNKVSFGSLEREYDKKIASNEIAIEIRFPWEILTTPEKYSSVTWDGQTYQYFASLPEANILRRLGEVEATAYDYDNNNQRYTSSFEVYEIKGITPAYRIALKMDGEYFVYRNRDYRTPGTLGEVWEEVRIDDFFELGRYTLVNNGKDQGHFKISDDTLIWDTLKACTSAPCQFTDAPAIYKNEYVSFTMTSETYGVYKVAMYITEDGTLWTNIFAYGFVCDIGKEAATNILDYVKANAVEVEYEPYLFSIGGTVTEVTEEYLLVDDTVLCADPADGMTFKVWMDTRTSYAIRMAYGFGVGDLVVVGFSEEKLRENNGQYEITNPRTIQEGYLDNGDIFIPE